MPPEAERPGAPAGGALAGPQLRVVAGLFRSGTTYLSEILRRGTRCPLLDEPLNIRRGMAGVPLAYPYVAAGGGEHARLIDDVVALARPWNRRTAQEHAGGVLRQAVRSARALRLRLHWDRLRTARALGMGPRCLLWKDPFATLAAPYLLARHGARMVCMVRHPGAIHVSLRKQGWRFNAGFLHAQGELLQAYGYDILARHWELAMSQPAVAVAILWKFMARVLGDLSGRERLLLVVKHEELCREPLTSAAAAARHLDIRLGASARRFIARHSSGERALAEHGRARDLVRDSAGLAEAWRRESLPEEEALMREVIGEDLFRIYERW